MTDESIPTIARGLSEARELCEDLTDNWDAFSDADPLPHPRDDFPASLERQGYAELVLVDDDALNDVFAEERGIYPGGSMWQLTATGRQLRAHLQQVPATPSLSTPPAPLKE